MGRLAGKRALITGAGGLMGAAFARAFAAEGAALVLSTRTASKLEPLAAELRGTGTKVATAAADFTSDSDVDRLADVAWTAFGGVNVVLFSSQPADPKMGDLLTTPDAAWREQQQAIAWGPLRLMRALAPRMMAAGGGSIITVVSSTGLDPIPGYDAYGMAKGALWMLTKYMAREWGKGGLRANAINPGLIATDGNTAKLTETVRANGMLGRTALGRVGTNKECVGAAVYLASDESSFMTGQQITIDGGRF